MFCSARQYRCKPDELRELVHRADEKLADRLAERPGFVAYEMIDCGDGRLMTITVFQEREQAEESVEMAAEFVRDELADVEIERTAADIGEVLVNRARSEVLELVHA